MGAVDQLLISEDLRKDVVSYTCENGHDEYELINSTADTDDHDCTRCSATVDAADAEREDAIDHLMELADQRGSETVFVSTDFEKGEQLLTAFGGVAGLLRYSTGV
jgi:peptide chain release factor subunit 1